MHTRCVVRARIPPCSLSPRLLEATPVEAFMRLVTSFVSTSLAVLDLPASPCAICLPQLAKAGVQ